MVWWQDYEYSSEGFHARFNSKTLEWYSVIEELLLLVLGILLLAIANVVLGLRVHF